MATDLELGFYEAGIAAGRLFVNVVGLAAYGGGGYLLLVETIVWMCPFLDIDRGPVPNFLIALVGLGCPSGVSYDGYFQRSSMGTESAIRR